jgi:uncharacterized protein (DUF58 family)
VLTRLGWGIAVASVALYAAGAWLGYPELAVLAVGGALAVASALLWTLPRPSLAVRREITPLKIARGEAAGGVLHVTNTGRIRRAGFRVHDPCGDGAIELRVPGIRAGGATSVTYALPTEWRGEIPVGPLRLISADPFGLARRVREYGEVQTFLVRPRSVSLSLVPSGREHHIEGPTTDTAPAGTVTFHTLREYVIGDDRRHIHWRSSARTGKLMIRQFVDASLPQTTIVIDTDQGAYADLDDFEVAVEAAASVAAGAAAASFPVRILTGEGPVAETRGGPQDAELILDRLAHLTAGDLPNSALDVARRVRKGGSLVLLTGARGATSGVGTLRRAFEKVVCVRIRPEAPAPAIPGIVQIDIADLDELRKLWKLTAR